MIIYQAQPPSYNFLPLDRTGNRRFAPVLVHQERVEEHILEDEKESREYIVQAWAEAMVIYKNCSHELKLSKEMEEHLKEMQKQFMPEDTKVGVIQAWLDDCTEEYVCSEMIYREALRHEYEEPKQWEIKEINSIMNTCIEGWEKSVPTGSAGTDCSVAGNVKQICRDLRRCRIMRRHLLRGKWKDVSNSFLAGLQGAFTFL